MLRSLMRRIDGAGSRRQAPRPGLHPVEPVQRQVAGEPPVRHRMRLHGQHARGRAGAAARRTASRCRRWRPHRRTRNRAASPAPAAPARADRRTAARSAAASRWRCHARAGACGCPGGPRRSGLRAMRFRAERRKEASRRPAHVRGRRWPTSMRASSMRRGENVPKGSYRVGISTMRAPGSYPHRCLQATTSP